MKGNSIAIVSMVGRFPAAPTLNELWNNITLAKDGITRWKEKKSKETDSLSASSHYVPARGIVEDIGNFDAAFFGFSPYEASIIDPQQRLFLQASHEALELAGYPSEEYGDKIGVFVSMADSSYLHNHVLSRYPEKNLRYQANIANSNHFLATRLSYLLNLTGPSFNIHTGCSSSLVAIVRACYALNNHECTLALAGGVRIQVPQDSGYWYQPGGVLSPNGVCAPFDKEASGTVSANGLGVVVLKRLEDAIAAGDTIRAVIKGAAINNDGIHKASFTAPSSAQQAACIQQAFRRAEVDPKSIGYMETHGTGTPLGDPIELRGLLEAHAGVDAQAYPCYLGALKANIGHTDVAAGVAGLIKVALTLEHAQIPPVAHFQQAHPEVNLSGTRFRVPMVLLPWDVKPGEVRRAAVSSFGIGGTNAHAILEEAPLLVSESSKPMRSFPLFVLSAKTANALEAYEQSWLAHIALQPYDSKAQADMAYTLQVGRRPFLHRVAYLLAVESGDGSSVLSQSSLVRVPGTLPVMDTLRTAFLFSDVSAQYAGWLGPIYHENPLLQKMLMDCLEKLESSMANAVFKYLCQQSSKDRRPELSNDVSVSALACFVGNYVLARLLMSWGVSPESFCGEGQSVYAAACLSGSLSLDDALALLSDKKAQSDHAIQPSTCSDFVENIKDLCAEKYTCFWEIGPENGLSERVNAGATSDAVLVISTLPNYQQYSADSRHASYALVKALATYWLCGGSIDWPAYYAGERRHRIPLPTYPFEQKSHWVEPAPAAPPPIASSTEPLQLPRWELTPLLNQEYREAEGPLLLFLPNANFSERFLAEYASPTITRIIVKPGKSFAQIDANSYQINPHSKKDYGLLYDTLAAIDSLPAQVIYAWSVVGTSSREATTEFYRDFWCLIYLLQVFAQEASFRCRMSVLLRNVKKVLAHDPIDVSASLLQGLCAVVPQEYPQWSCRWIDTGWPTLASQNIEGNFPDILKELSDSRENRCVVYRDHLRFTEQYRAAHEVALPSETKPLCLKTGGVYLITGGLGRIGLELAEYLADHYQAHIVLIGRNAEKALEDERKDRLHHIKAKASTVWIRNADVASPNQMELVFAAIQAEWGSIDAIFHLAGAIGKNTYCLIREITEKSGAAQFIPKIQGVQVIADLLSKYSAGYCVLFSSLSTVLGGIGLAAYAAANACLDAYAQAFSAQTSCTWVSINWDAWHFDGGRKREHGFLPQTALKQFARAEPFFHAFPQIFVAEQPVVYRNTNTMEALTKDTVVEERSQSSEEKICALFASALGVDSVDMDDDFYDLGGNSLLAIQLLSKINQSFSAELALSDFVVDCTPAELLSRIQRSAVKDLVPTLMPIKSSGKGSPLFLLHPVGGTVFCFLALAKLLAPETPCYAIQDPSIGYGRQLFDSLRTMATCYIRAIEQQQPEGPYWLGGFSFGGTLALEVARQLKEKGKSVKAIFLVDAWAAFSEVLHSEERFAMIMKTQKAQLHKQLMEQIYAGCDWVALSWERMQFLFDYQPEKTDVPLILFKAKELLPEYQDVDDPYNHWSEYSERVIDTYAINGNHETVLHLPNVEAIATIINRYLVNSTTETHWEETLC